MEIQPGIHLIKESLSPVFDDPNCWTSILVIVSDRVAIVDTGLPGSISTVILPYLDRIDMPVERIDYIVNTHGHADHIGSNDTLRHLSGAELLIHIDDADKLERGTKWGNDAIAPHRADRTLNDGDIVDLGRRQFQIIHLPGHSEGSVALYEEATGTLISGDALQGLGTTIQNLPLVFDPDAYAGSVERARMLAIESLVTAHPYWPLKTKSYTDAAGLREFMTFSQYFVDQVDGRLIAIVQELREAGTIENIADRLSRAIGMGGGTRLGAISTFHYLERLVRTGAVKAAGTGSTRTYAAS